MKLYVMNGIAFFKEMGYIPNKPLKVELDIPGMDYACYTVSVKVNDMPSKSCKDYFTIYENELEKMTTLKVDVTIKHRKTGIKQVFKMDPVPIKQAFAVGGDLYDMYPVSFTGLLERVKKIETQQKTMVEAIVEIGRKGEIL